MKKVLFVLFRKFDIIPDGGDQCNRRNLEVVKNIFGESEIDIYYVCKYKHTTVKEIINFIWFLNKGYYRGITPKVVSDICTLASNYENVFLSSSLFGQISYGLKNSGYNGKIIVQFHNVETLYYQNILPKCLLLRKKIIECISYNEQLAISYANVRLALNKRDAEILDSISSNKVDYIIPITLQDKCKNISQDETVLINRKPLIAFIGSNFPPNANSVLWFVKNVLPHIDVNFIVVGKNMSRLKRRNKILKNIDIRSNVPDISSYFENSDIIISPIFSGSGMKVKTCEALMYGKIIVGSSEAFEGYELNYDKVGCKANTPEDYIEFINKISKNPRPRFNKYSRQVYLERYSNEVAYNMFNKFLK